MHASRRKLHEKHMIVIGLDENGKFEQVEHDQCMFIAGVAYVCRAPEDAQHELIRLRELFQRVCAEQHALCPEDLHYNWRDGKVVNGKTAESVKDALSAALPDFFKNRKTDEGSYYIYCMIGDKRTLYPEASGSFRDDYAAVRYEHMVYRTVENLIFYNPFFRKEDTYKLELATRVAGISDDKIREEMQTLGYAYRRDETGGFDRSKAVITDEASFRTCLESAILNHDRTNLKIDLNVQSIRYRGDEYIEKQGFLYLSDIICSVLQKAIGTSRTIESAMPKLVSECSRLTPSFQGLIWTYDAADILWRKTWTHFCNQRWFEALQLSQEEFERSGVIPRIYRKIWIEKMKEALSRENTAQALHEAVKKLSAYMDDMQNRNLQTGMAIARQLEKHMKKLQDVPAERETAYWHWKTMFGIFNHLGKPVQAQRAYIRCIENARYIPIEEYLGLQLMRIVSLCDQQKYYEAEQLAETILSYQRILADIRKEVFPEHQMVLLSYARTLSQYGQCLAFQGQYDRAIEQFREALGIFEERSGDWLVTSTYLLHALIENGDALEYQQWADAFYGDTGLRGQVKNVIHGTCGKLSYALYPLIKSVWFLKRETMTEKELRWVIGKTEELLASSREHGEGGHPWENIMKYCAMLQADRLEKDGNHERSEELLQAGIRSVEDIHDSILEKIAARAVSQVHQVTGTEADVQYGEIRFIYD